jgi:hypothetical protein
VASNADRIADVLRADVDLTALLDGGIHRKSEITRQNAADAFDDFGQIKGTALVKSDGEFPAGPGGRAAVEGVSVYLYHRDNLDLLGTALERVLALVDRTQIVGAFFEARTSYVSGELEDQALGCPMRQVRFDVTKSRWR